MEISKILNDIIKELNCTMTAFASMIQFNKSFVCKVFKDEKKLSPNMLDAVLKCENISENSKQKLQRAFLRQKYDEFDEELVIHFFNSLNGPAFSTYNLSVPETRDSTFETKFFSDSIPYHIGNKSEFLEIAAFFAKKLSKRERSFLYTNYPVSQKELDDCLFSVLYNRDYRCDIDFCRILNFPRYFSVESIDVITQSFRWATAGFNTMIKIDYVQKNDTFLSPYYLITDDAVISFNREMNCGMVFTDKPTVIYFKNEFLKIRSGFRPALSFVEEEFELYRERSEKTESLIFSVNNLFPMELCLDSRPFIENISDPNRDNDLFIDFAVSLFCESTATSDYNIYTSESALEHFVETGETFLVFDQHFKELTPVCREKILLNLLDRIKNRKINLTFLDGEKFSAEKLISHEFYSNMTILNLVFTNEPFIKKKKYYSARMILQNYDIVGFDSFVESIDEYLRCGVLTLPKEKVERIIKNAIIKLRHIKNQ